MLQLRKRSSVIASILVGLAGTSITVAQSSQYVQPGSVQGPRQDPRAQIADAIEEARWKLGAVRLDPWIGIDRLGYVSDSFVQGGGTETDDFVAVASAGVQGYLPVGDKTFVTFHALPQYVWWQDQDERRGLNQHLGGALLGFYNRLQIELDARISEELGIVTRELEQEIVQRQEILRADFAVNLYRSLTLVAGARATGFETVDESPFADNLFGRLDRDETVGRVGLQIRTGIALWTAGFEESTTDFLGGAAAGESISGGSWFAGAFVEGGSGWINLDLSNLDLEPDHVGSSAPPLSTTTGVVEAGWVWPGDGFTSTLYWRRGLNYSLSVENFYLLGDSTGMRLDYSPGVSIYGAFFETGTDEYRGSQPREDDRTSWGVTYSRPILRTATLIAGYSSTEVDTAPGFAFPDREIKRFQIGLSFTPFGTSRQRPSLKASGL